MIRFRYGWISPLGSELDEPFDGCKPVEERVLGVYVEVCYGLRQCSVLVMLINVESRAHSALAIRSSLLFLSSLRDAARPLLWFALVAQWHEDDEMVASFGIPRRSHDGGCHGSSQLDFDDFGIHAIESVEHELRVEGDFDGFSRPAGDLDVFIC